MSESQLMKPKEVCEYLGISLPTLDRWTRKKKIPYIKLVGSRRFDRKDLDAWVKECNRRRLK